MLRGTRRPLVAATAVLVGLAGLAGLTTVAPQAAAATPPDGPPAVWTGTLTRAQFGQLAAAGVDRHEIATAPAGAGTAKVEVVLDPATAGLLVAKGVPLARKTAAAAQARAAAAAAPTVFRKYSGAKGLRAEYEGIAEKYPKITKLETIGTTVQGKPIIALKVTKAATTTKDGARPATLYVSNQHAREWITPEMNRRLLHHVVEGYATDKTLKKLVDTTELWFVPSANPDGYDYTFTEGNRLWRKNLRDNDGDGKITGVDGVDPNRNFPTKWGYDNEGSSDSPSSETFRGTGPASEPETKALDGLLKRVKFRFLINYHSAAELLLYGVGWQVDTPTPDDALYETMVGDDAKPAVPGYDPDLSAELYTTNGETDDHASSVRGTLAFTPEMSTCESASAVDPDDAFDPADCESVFNFPDSEPLVQAEFEKNLPFALAVARSAPDPDDPVSVVGRKAPDFVPDTFSVSYGDPQTVAVTAKRALKNLTLNWSVNGGARKTAPVKEFTGGERYGDSGDLYYAEYRGQVKGTKAGDKVKVWFTGSGRSSTPFTYAVKTTKKASVLVIADEDVKGVNPTYPASVTGPKYAKTYTDALAAKNVSSAVWDVDTQGAPSALGVLSHFQGVVWYLGENRVTQDAADEPVSFLGDELPDSQVADREHDLTIAVRDFLNEGGKLVHAGETAGYYGPLADTLGGAYYGLNGDPSAPCVVTEDPFGDCLLLADDFRQYWLGAYRRQSVDGPASVEGTSGPLSGLTATFGGAGATANPLNEAGSFIPTSSVLPVKTYPQFRSQAAATYRGTKVRVV